MNRFKKIYRKIAPVSKHQYQRNMEDLKTRFSKENTGLRKLIKNRHLDTKRNMNSHFSKTDHLV